MRSLLSETALAVAVFCAVCVSDAAVVPEYAPDKLGVRSFPIGEREYKIPWYVVRADYNTIRTTDFWKRLGGLPGTKAAYVGYYHNIRWCQWFDDRTREQVSAQGVDFLASGDFRVSPGPGKVYVRRWLFEEKGHADTMAFKDGRYYVFCLDRGPVARWRSSAKEPGCDLDTELEHVVGIIAIQPTFDFDERASTSPFYVTADSLLTFREERYGGPGAGYEQEYAVIRSKDRTLQTQTRTELNVVAGRETVQKLLYAINTCEWTKRTEPHALEISPAVTRAILEYKAKQGQARTVVFSYDKGGWYTDRFDSAYYSAIYPQLLFEVQEDIRTAREAESTSSQRSRRHVSETPDR